MVRIRLTRKLALTMNGVDVSRLRVGDILELDDERAQMLIECGWGEQAVDGCSLKKPIFVARVRPVTT